MAASPGLLSLPEEVLWYIGQFLSPQDLLALSAACQRLRTVFNVNSVWRKYTHGGHVSRALDDIRSVVEPTILTNESSTLEPPCEHRLYFLKQKLLLYKLRQGMFVEHSSNFAGYIATSDKRRPLSNHQVTYKGVYLFAFDRKSEGNIINVYNIENSLNVETTIILENHSCNFRMAKKWTAVVGNKLVVWRDNWVDIYQIKLPETIEVLDYFNVNESNHQLLKVLILKQFLFVENFTLNVVHVWDLSSGNQLDDIRSETEGAHLGVIGCSENQKYIIFTVGFYSDSGCAPSVLVYDVELLQFTSFCVNLERNHLIKGILGFFENGCIVLLKMGHPGCNSVLVFEFSTSRVLAESPNILRCVQNFKVIKNCLVLPTLENILIMDLKSLQIIWELSLKGLESVDYISSKYNLVNLIVTRTHDGTTFRTEVWDLEKRVKVLDLPQFGYVFLNDNCSKLIFWGGSFLKVFSFW